MHECGRGALVALAEGDSATAQRLVTEMRGHSERVVRYLDEFARTYDATVGVGPDEASKAA